MGVASMIIGILAAILAFIPFCGYFAFVPAIVGLILGLVDVTKKKKVDKPKGQGVAGIVLNAIAIGLIFLYTIIFGAAAAVAADEYDDALDAYDEAYNEALDAYNDALKNY